MIRIDAAWLATAPLDMRAGTDTALARVVDQHDVPFTRDDGEPLAGLLHMAAWRCRTREQGCAETDLLAGYPDTAALALSLELNEVLAHKPVEWASETDVDVLAG